MMDISQLSDAELLSRVAAGDAAAEEALAERYSRLVRICARPLFLAGGDSEDLIQEGMLGLLSAIRQYDPASNVPFKAYAEVCISNRIYSAIKSASRQKHSPLNSGISLDSILSEESQTQASTYPGANCRVTEEQVLARESEQELLSAFTRYLSAFEARACRMQRWRPRRTSPKNPSTMPYSGSAANWRGSPISATSARAERNIADRQVFQKRGFIMFEDKTLKCKECGADFIFTAGEQEFYAEKGFQNEPQRCKACRDARKNAARGPREFFTATCAACGGEARVPFEPKSDRPVYCSECFAKMREQH